jgi:hypothetical protein
VLFPSLPMRDKYIEVLFGRPGILLARFFIFALAVACCCGCAPAAATVARMDGFDAQWRGFNSLKSDPDLHYETEIKVKVIVVGNLADIGYPGAAATYSHPEGAIRIVGKRINGKIVLCPAVIGHEIQHALEYQDGGFANPDKLEEYGY